MTGAKMPSTKHVVGARVAQDVDELLRGEPEVQRIDDAGPQVGGVVQLEVLGGVEGEHGEAVAPADAERAQGADGAADPVEVLGEGTGGPGGRIGDARPVGDAVDRREEVPVVQEFLHARILRKSLRWRRTVATAGRPRSVAAPAAMASRNATTSSRSRVRFIGGTRSSSAPR